MFDEDAWLEYLNSPSGINQIIIGIILFGAINAILMTYSVRISYGAEKRKKDRLMRQKIKIDKLSPKKCKHMDHF